MYNANCLEIRCIYPILSIAWIHNYNPNLVICTPPFLKYATKVKLSTGAGLLVRDGTSYPLKMVIEKDGIWRLSQHQKWLCSNRKRKLKITKQSYHVFGNKSPFQSWLRNLWLTETSLVPSIGGLGTAPLLSALLLIYNVYGYLVFVICNWNEKGGRGG
jgi:hypothetical protein